MGRFGKRSRVGFLNSMLNVAVPLVFAAGLLVVLMAVAESEPADVRAHRVLQAQGFTEVRLTGWRWFGCGDDDTFRTGFEATSSAGVRVSGVVCAGLLAKSATVRFD